MENGKAKPQKVTNSFLSLETEAMRWNVEMPVANREKPPTSWREEGILGTDSSYTDEASLFMNRKFVISMLFVHFFV